MGGPTVPSQAISADLHHSGIFNALSPISPDFQHIANFLGGPTVPSQAISADLHHNGIFFNAFPPFSPEFQHNAIFLMVLTYHLGPFRLNFTIMLFF